MKLTRRARRRARGWRKANRRKIEATVRNYLVDLKGRGSIFTLEIGA
jgi:hypothetical protein